MAADVKIDIAAEFTGKKAFKQAETATEKMTKNVKGLAASLGLAFGTQRILAFGKASVKAAAADQKAQQQLALALKNVGLERDAASSEAYIQSLQSQFGIVDDLLRPAYQTLAIATRNTAESQRLLNLSLDISAATGKDLGSVTTALSRAYLGNNTALTRLGVGISKADLKTKSFYDITTDLASTFKGSATAAAATFQGSIDKLGVASANVQEIIGTGLIDALKGLGEDNSVDDLAQSMESAAFYTADVIRGIGVLTQKLKSLPGVGNFNIGMIPIVGSYLEILRGLGKQSTSKPFTTPMTISGQSQQSTKITKEQGRVAKETLKISKDQLKLAKAKAIFDIQKIQIEAALKGKISEEERIRLLLLKAIAEENIEDIEKYTKMLNLVQGKVEDLQATLAEVYAMDAGNPFIEWEIGLDGVQRALIEINEQSIELTSTIAQNSLAMGLLGGASFAQALSGARYAAQAAASMGITGVIGNVPIITPATTIKDPNTVVNVVIEGTVMSNEDLKQSIVDAINSAGVSGTQTITGTPDRQVAL
jgi:hypothetical protein